MYRGWNCRQTQNLRCGMLVLNIFVFLIGLIPVQVGTPQVRTVGGWDAMRSASEVRRSLSITMNRRCSSGLLQRKLRDGLRIDYTAESYVDHNDATKYLTGSKV